MYVYVARRLQRRIEGVVNMVNEVMDQEGRTGRALLRSRDRGPVCVEQPQ